MAEDLGCGEIEQAVGCEGNEQEPEHGDMEHGEIEDGETVHKEIENGEIENGGLIQGEIEHGMMERVEIEHSAIEDGEIEHGEMKKGEIDPGEKTEHIDQEAPEHANDGDAEMEVARNTKITNITRNVNAVQVTICLLVSTSVY